MHLAIFGASGRTGRLIVTQALARGHSVTALVRDPTRLAIADERMRVVAGNAMDPATVEAVVAGRDAVLSTLGAKLGLTGFPRTTVYSGGARTILSAMKSTGTRRLVFCTSEGAEDHDPHATWLYRYAIKPLLLQRGHDDMKLAEQAIQASDIDWVLVRPLRLVDRHPKSGEFRVSARFTPVHGSAISRADLAGFMLDQVHGDRWVRKTPTLAY